MSKYQVDNSKVRKDEVNESFLQQQIETDKLSFAYSKAAAVPPNKPSGSERNKSQEKSIDSKSEKNPKDGNALLDLSKEQEVNPVNRIDNVKEREEKEAQKPLENDQKHPTSESNDQKQATSNVPVVQGAKTRVVHFFASAQGQIEERSRSSMNSLFGSLSSRNQAKKKSTSEKLVDKEAEEQKQSQDIKSSDQLDAISKNNEAHPAAIGAVQVPSVAHTGEGSFTSKKIPTNQQQVKSSTHLNNQDFGNISEIVGVRNQITNMIGGDDTAQEEDDEDFKSLLINQNNNNKGKHTLVHDDVITEQVENGTAKKEIVIKDQKLDSPKNQNHKKQQQNSEKHGLKQQNDQGDQEQNNDQEEERGREKDERLLTESMVAYNNSNNNNNKERDQTSVSPSKQKMIDDAMKKKRKLEAALRELNGEINVLATDQAVVAAAAAIPANNLVKFIKISDDKDAQLRALEFVRKMNQARKEKQEKHDRMNAMQLKQVISETKQSQEVHKKVQEQHHERISQVKLARLEEIEQRKKDRIQVNRVSNKIIKDLVHVMNDPNQRYHQEVEVPELERRKQILAEKRQLFKPIGLDEIKQHALKHDEEIRMRKLNAKAKIVVDYDEAIAGVIRKSAVLNKILEDDKGFKMKSVLELKRKKEQIERRNEYAKLVKEVHVPRLRDVELEEQEEYERKLAEKLARKNERMRYGGVNSKSQQGIIKSNRSPANGFVDNSSGLGEVPFDEQQQLSAAAGEFSSVRQMKRKNNNVDENQQSSQISWSVKSSKKQPMNLNLNPSMQLQQQQQEFSGQNYLQQNERNNSAGGTNQSFSQNRRSSHNYEIQQGVQTVPVRSYGMRGNGGASGGQSHHIDYISEMRKKREASEKKTGKKPAKLDDWEKYKYDPNLSQKEKYAYILQTAARIENNARIKELSNKNDFESQEQSNNLYIDAIKAKLSLFDSLQ